MPELASDVANYYCLSLNGLKNTSTAMNDRVASDRDGRSGQKPREIYRNAMSVC